MTENCYTICPLCNKITAARVKFCTQCGKERTPTLIPKTPMVQSGASYSKVCHACKKIYDATENFCGNCGQPLAFCNTDPRFEAYQRDTSRDNVKQEAAFDDRRFD